MGSTAYKKRKKAIKRRQWDFSLLKKRQEKKDEMAARERAGIYRRAASREQKHKRTKTLIASLGAS
ncbi:MAG: hypothetical protein GTN99_02770 [Candidatus Dadabacteria bacterium]|nr:hypothetical protein [Candidatus Dadabacteria bacterium]